MSIESTSCTPNNFWTTPKRVVAATAVADITTGAAFFGKWIGSTCNGQWDGGPPILLQPSVTTAPPSCFKEEIAFSLSFAGVTLMLLAAGLICMDYVRCARTANTNVEAVRANAINRSPSSDMYSLDEKSPLVRTSR